MDEQKLIEINGVKFYAPNPDDFIYASMIKNKELWDIERIRYMLQFITKRSIVIDVGAHVGCHTIQFAKRAKTVIAIEPVEQNYKLWETNIKLNGLTNCQLFKIAASNKIDEHLTIDSERERLSTNSGATYLIQSKHGMIRTITLDSLSIGDSPISFIKYDVEEMELEALEGSKRILKEYKPALYVEIISDRHKNNKKHNSEQTIHFLNCSGYMKTKVVGVWVNKNNKEHIRLINE